MENGLVQHYDTMDKVIRLYTMGEKNPTQIADQLRMKRKDVLDYIDEWKKIARNRPDAKERADEALEAMTLHYDMIIKEMWVIVNEEMDNRTRSSTLKAIADIEEKRQKAMQQAGIYSDTALADEMAEIEAMADKLKELMTQVAIKYPETKTFIMQELANIFGKANSGGGVSVPDPEGTAVIKGEILN